MHAGVVARNGRGVVFPGAADAGKSTLTAACLLEGFDYLSDEALCLDFESTEVIACPKALALSDHSVDLLGLRAVEQGSESVHTAASLGANFVEGPVFVAHVVRAEVGSDDEPSLHALPRSEVVSLLLSRSFNHYRDPPRSLDLVHRVAEQTQAWALRLGDPRAAARLLRERLELE